VHVAIVLAAVVIIGGMVVVALGRGGELARDARDESRYPDFESAADVSRYRPPAALLGYHARSTEHALQVIGRTIADRDAEIAWLRARLRELRPEGERQDGTLTGLSSSNAASVADPVLRQDAAPAGAPADDPGWLQPADSAAQQSQAARRAGDDE
jgi:hypothetical protein